MSNELEKRALTRAEKVQRQANYMWVLGSILCLIFGGLALLVYSEILDFIAEGDYLSEKEISDFKSDFVPLDVVDLTALAIVTLVGPSTLVYVRDWYWRNGVDSYLPSLLREISDAQKTGLPLPRAITQASRRQYGPLTEELQKMASKISWGIPFPDAMRTLAVNADTSLVRRASLLILEAERAGGAIEEVFDSAHDHVNELLALRRERLAQMRPYTFIIYASYLVFALVIIILLQTFFAQMAEQARTQILQEFTAEQGRIELPLPLVGLQMVFFHLLMIEGSLSGLVAGKMGEGNIKTGLRHSIYLTIAGYLIFKVTVVLGIISF
ncbi:MAG: type II secretion system F family protein [Promethearchaeota archaeon]